MATYKSYICSCSEGYIIPRGEICPFCFVPKKERKRSPRASRQLLKDTRDKQILIQYITGRKLVKIAHLLGIDIKTVKRVILKHKKGNEITNNEVTA